MAGDQPRTIDPCLPGHRSGPGDELFVVEPSSKLGGNLKEIVEGNMRGAVATAKLKQLALGEHQIGAAGNAEIRAAVTDDDLHGRKMRFGKRTLAVPGQHPAIAARGRKRHPPAVAVDRLEMIGMKRHAEARAAQNGVDDDVEAIRHDGHAETVAHAFAHEHGKTAIDADARRGGHHLLRCRSQQAHLTRHAFARADPTGLPFLLDVAPGGIGKLLEQHVGGVAGCNRPVEVDEDMALHTRTGHVNPTL